MVDRRCPRCGSELADYFANTDEWTTIQDFACEYSEHGTPCGHCRRIDECNDVVECEHCGEWLDIYAMVMQPCGDNEQVMELRFSLRSSSDNKGLSLEELLRLGRV